MSDFDLDEEDEAVASAREARIRASLQHAVGEILREQGAFADTDAPRFRHYY
jgi:hypothetical protein